jgi:5-hydroxyisourate hydrolase-like protein (transthyretin family)
MSSAALSYTSGQPRRLSAKRRGGTASSASSLAADAAIRDFNDGRRRRSRGDYDQGGESALGRSVDEFASNVSATVESLGMPRWIVRALVLAGVGIVLAVAVINTLPMLARHAVSGTATFNGKPLASVTVNFQKITGSTEADSRVIRTAADGSFQIAAGEGLPSGLYAVSVRPGESGRPIPPNYLSPETTPLRFEIREDLTGLQLSISDGKQRIRGSRR